jgi:hypothetical protein
MLSIHRGSSGERLGDHRWKQKVKKDIFMEITQIDAGGGKSQERDRN